MDIRIVSNDIELQKKFIETKYFDDVVISSEFKGDNTIKFILVSDQLITFNNFIEQLTSDVRENNVIFYMLSSNLDAKLKNHSAILKAKGVICIPPKLTLTQIVEKVCREIGIVSNSNRNITVFFGTDSKVGVTMTAQSVAENIAANTDTTVGLLFLNGKPSMDYIKAEKYSIALDKLKLKIVSNVLSPNELLDSCIKIDNLYVLQGAELIYGVRHYHPKHIENLIELATKVFGIVIIDAGCDLNNGMSIGAINSTSNRFLVTTQQDTALDNFNRTNDQILNALDIQASDFMMVINKYVSSSQLYTPSELADKVYNIPLAGIIPKVDYSWQAERDKNTFNKYNLTDFNKQITELGKLVCSQVGIEYKQSITKKFRFFGMFK